MAGAGDEKARAEEAAATPPARRFGARVRSLLHRGAGVSASALLFAGAFTGSLIAHGDLPATRRLAADVATRVLAPIFFGKIIVREIDHFGFDGIDVREAEVLDPTGRRVVRATGVHGRFSVLGIVRALADLPSGLSLRFDDIAVDDAEVVLDADTEGHNRIARAFTPRPPPPTPPSLEPPKPPKPLRIELPSIVIARAWAHGEPVTGLPIDARGVRVPGRVLVSSTDGVQVDVERFPLRATVLSPVDPRGVGEYHLRIPVTPPQPAGAPPAVPAVRMTASFSGRAAGISVSASALLDGADIGATLDAARVSPEDLVALLPGAALTDNVSIHLEARGPPSAVRFKGRSVAGPGDVTVDGTLALGTRLVVDGEVHVRDLDPRVFSARAPVASVGGDASVRATLDGARLAVDVDAATFPLTLAGQPVPGAAIRARWADGEVRGNADLYEPGIPTQVAFHVERGGVVNLEADVRAPRLRDSLRLRGAVDGAIRGKVKARIDAGGIEAKVDATASGFGKGTTGVGSGHITGRVAGPFDRLFADLTLDGQAVKLSGNVVERARVRLVGAPATPHVTVDLIDPRWSELRVEGDVALIAGARVSNLKGAFTRSEIKTSFSAAGLDASPGRVELRGVEVKSDAGTAAGKIALSPAGLTGTLSGSADLEKLGQLVPALTVSHGKASFELELTGDGRKRSGSLRAKLSQADIALLPLRTSSDVSITLRDEDVTADVTVSVASLGSSADTVGPELVHAHATGTGKLTGSITSPKAWSELTGDAEVDRLAIDLDNLFANDLVDLALRKYKQIPRLSGALVLSGHAKRDVPTGLPDVDAKLATEKLAVALPETGTRPATTLRGLDGLVTLATRRQGAPDAKGEQRFEVDVGARVSDEEGALASVTTRSTVPARATLRDLVALASGEGSERADARERLVRIPLAARATWMDRPFEKWPEPLRVTGLRGRVSASVDLAGTLDSPRISGSLRASDLAAVVPGATPWVVDGAISGRLDGDSAEVVATVLHAGAPVVELGASARVRIPDLVWGKPGADAWTASGTAKLAGFQLDAIPALAAAGFTGIANGSVHVAGIHDKPRIDVDLAVQQARLLDAPLESARLAGWIAEDAGVVTLTVDQPAGRAGTAGGKLRVTAFPSVRFEKGVFPRPDPDRPQTLAVQLSRFDIEPFAPFTAPVLADLRGRLDGEATLTVAKRERPGALPPTNLWGSLSLREGVVIIPQLGQTFTKGQLDAKTEQAGDATDIVISNVSFAATSGRARASGRFRVPTAGVAGLLYGISDMPPATVTGDLKLDIDATEKIPVTFEGVPLGDAYGHVDASLRAEKRNVDIAVALPSLTFELPESEARGVQKLAEDPDVGLMDRRYREGTKKRGQEAVRVLVHVGLGATLDEVRTESPTSSGKVLVRRGGLDVQLSGRPTVELADTLRVTGTVDTVSGRVTALGKPFNVERGFVRFDGDNAQNPYLALRASWDSPEGGRVYAELSGYLQDAKLRLRSDPPRSESEVLGLLLFGRDPSASSTVPGQINDQGVAAGSGVASTVLNSLLDPVEVFGQRFETRVDTTSARGTSIGVATEIRPRLWAQVDVSTAQQRDRQNADLSALTLDWRFQRNWSLRTTVGDRGSSVLELLWQYRY